MKILILTIGSRGDVQPYVALGHGLQAAGHRVTLCTGEMFADFVADYNLSYARMDDEMVRLADSPEGRQMIEGGGNMLNAIKMVRPMQERMMADAWTAARDVDPELIIYHPKTLSGYHIAEKQGIPVILSMVLPSYTPTREFANPLINRDLGGWLNKQTYKIMPLVSMPYVGVINDFREELGLAKVGRFFDERVLPDGSPIPTLYGYSRHIVPRPADWPDTAAATGYWFLETRGGWMPPAGLVHFLEAGPPPVYIGFGSMAGTQPERLATAAVEALLQTGQRGLLASGWGGLSAAELPDTIYTIDHAPHDWLFPHMAAVVHHGGSGTTAAGLRAGRPTLVCPFFGDQPFWGKRVYQLGAGPEPIPQKELAAPKLAQAIKKLTDDPAIQANARQIGEQLRREDGIGNAVQFVESVVQR
jgi:sterol 3beta-glucosyltransferase